MTDKQTDGQTHDHGMYRESRARTVKSKETIVNRPNEVMGPATGLLVFTARAMLCAVYAMAVCMSVCVCLPQVGVLLKWLNIGARKQRHTIAQGL